MTKEEKIIRNKLGLIKLASTLGNVRQNALVAADFLNDRVIPWYDEHEVRLLRILTDRGTEYCGNRERHEYQLNLAIGLVLSYC